MDGHWQGFGRLLLLSGAILMAAGLALSLAPKIPWLGKLPGDFVFQRERMTLYVPLGTSILLSVVLTAVLWILGRMR